MIMFKKHLPILAAVCIILLIIFSVAYLNFIDAFVPHSGAKFSPGWTDNTFLTEHGGLSWSDDDFENGWTIAWQLGQNSSSSGFETSNGTLVLHASFNGFNKNQEKSISGIMVQKDLNRLNTTVSPFLIIKHKESTSDSALMFSFGITDIMGVWHDGGRYFASNSWSNIYFDLRQIYNGTIAAISIRLTNDFDPNYVAGTQYAYVESIAIYERFKNPDWTISASQLVNTTLSSERGVLNLSASGYLSEGLLVSAQRRNNLSINAELHNYLMVSIRTSSINIAARIVIWPDQNVHNSREVLLKTYNDNDWHTEIIDLSYFILPTDVFMIELGFAQIYPSNTNEWITYKTLSFNSLEV